MNQTTKYLFNILRLFADNHRQIRRVEEGFEDAITNFSTEEQDFPILYIAPVSTTPISTSRRGKVLRIFCFDLLNRDGSNVDDLISDTEQILNDVILYFSDQSPATDITLNNNPSITKMNNSLLDRAVGSQMDIDFDLGTVTNCDIPFQSGVPTVVGGSITTIGGYLTCSNLDQCQTIIDIENTIGGYLTCSNLDQCQTIIDIENTIAVNDYTTSVDLTGNILSFDRTDLVDAYSIDLSPIISTGFDCSDLSTCQTIIDIESSILANENDIAFNETDILANQTDIGTNTTDIFNLTSTVAGLPTSNDYTTSSTLVGNVIQFDRTDGSNLYSVDLSPIIPTPFDCSDLSGCQTIIDIESDIGTNESDIATNVMDIQTNATDISNKIDTLQTIDTKTSDYTFISTDLNKLIRSDNTTNLIFTVDDTLSIGTHIDITRFGTGELTIDAPLVTINSPEGFLQLRVQHSTATLVKTGVSEYLLIGDLK